MEGSVERKQMIEFLGQQIAPQQTERMDVITLCAWLCVWSVPLVVGGGQTASTFACINSESAMICGCATLWGCFSVVVFFCLCPASAASVWVLIGIRNKHRMMIQTWIINTVSFLPELLLNNFVQMNPETPSSPDTDTGIWYHKMSVCNLPPHIYMEMIMRMYLKTFILVTVLFFVFYAVSKKRVKLGFINERLWHFMFMWTWNAVLEALLHWT